MATEAVVRARIDAKVKKKAARVLDDMGLTLSDAIRLLLLRIAAEKALPFTVKVPNARTRAAMKEADSNAGKAFSTVDELLADLNASD